VRAVGTGKLYRQGEEKANVAVVDKDKCVWLPWERMRYNSFGRGRRVHGSNRLEGATHVRARLDSRAALPCDSRMLIEGSPPTYVSPGFVIYGSGETLLARRFDAEKLQLTYDVVPIAEHVARGTGFSVLLASVSLVCLSILEPGEAG